MADGAAPRISLATATVPWWERRWFLALVVAATMLPFIYPPIPPLVDLLGHLGHYRVEIDHGRSPWLQHYYGFRWAPIGNLGVDILVLVLAPVMGLEPAVKLIVLLMPPITAAGMLWVAREVHGRVPPTAFFALPFIYGLPLMFGFVNFTLSMGLAFLAFGLWLRLGRLGHTRLRGWLFVPISIAVFFGHTYGWGLLGLMCFSAEAVRLRDHGRSWWRAVVEAALHASVLLAPLAVLLLWPVEAHGGLGAGWFEWGEKWTGVIGALRDRWGPFDVAGVELACVIFLFALVSPKLTLSRTLGLLAGVLATSFILLPRFIFDSAYADVRLLPYLFAIALLAIRLREPANARLGNFLALLGLAFFALRLAGTTASMAMAADSQTAKLGALDHIPRGARVASFYVLPAAEPWALHRESHMGALVIARREGFSNDEWITAGHNLLELKYREAGTFASNPSQVVRPSGALDGNYLTIDQALAGVPRDKFDYVWLINVQPFDHRLVRDIQPVWRGPGTLLYRIPHRSSS